MPEISLVPGIGISASGLDAESRRMEIIANNVANSQTTRDVDGEVYKRKEVVFTEIINESLGKGKIGGVEVTNVVEDSSPGRKVYRPGHPDSGADGYLEMPNVNSVAEMVDMMSSSRAFDANLSAIKVSRSMATKAMGIFNAM